MTLFNYGQLMGRAFPGAGNHDRPSQTARAWYGFLHRAALLPRTSLRRKPIPGNARRHRQQSSLGQRRRPPRSFFSRGDVLPLSTLPPLEENAPSGGAGRRSRRPGLKLRGRGGWQRQLAASVDSDRDRVRFSDRDWEIKLEPPVNRVIPVGRSHLAALWAAYGEV